MSVFSLGQCVCVWGVKPWIRCVHPSVMPGILLGVQKPGPGSRVESIQSGRGRGLDSGAQKVCLGLGCTFFTYFLSRQEQHYIKKKHFGICTIEPLGKILPTCGFLCWKLLFLCSIWAQTIGTDHISRHGKKKKKGIEITHRL